MIHINSRRYLAASYVEIEGDGACFVFKWWMAEGIVNLWIQDWPRSRFFLIEGYRAPSGDDEPDDLACGGVEDEGCSVQALQGVGIMVDQPLAADGG